VVGSQPVREHHVLPGDGGRRLDTSADCGQFVSVIQ
jgi:hypothetical protein